ncbi:hypothetical protein [Pseudomonas jinjuensis]|uniref:Lipoprotein n=1 Tax=Pseudomonas jinjuensis TaxID=198616 RepID=A0A1H0M9V6_9PSED|nr:hypothetical protein [Pseudomonas jinjuensis]SDO77242.1 hypothetical protein SAMN05216193_115155 [Pseudomonas jinjuensis]
MKMKSMLALPLMAALCACASAGKEGEPVNVMLDATQRNAGRIGQATLSPADGKTYMTVFISGAPQGTTRPLRLYTYIYQGACASPDARPAYELNDTAVTHRNRQVGAGWSLYKVAPVPLATLRAGDYSIVLRTSPADGNYDIFCGAIH